MANVEKEPSWREQFAALGNLPPYFKLIWTTHKGLTLGNALLRMIKAFLPLCMLFVGKEIIDQVVVLVNDPHGEQTYLWQMVGLEFFLAVLSDLIGRSISLLDALLGDLMTNTTSEMIIRHAADLDLYQFEDPAFYDKLERARRYTVGRTVLLTQALTQVQDTISLLALGAGLVFFNPWLMLLLVVAVIPAFVGENYFNQQSYSLSKNWTPERRELDYLRYIGASDTTAKEVKIFGLTNFLVTRFRELSQVFYIANRKLATRRAFWGGLLAALGTAAYYGAYVFIIAYTLGGAITLGTLTFLAGAFNRMQGMLQGILLRFSGIAEQALYLQDFFDFLAIVPRITSQPGALPFPTPVKEGFTFENVSFRYPDAEHWAIRRLSFRLNPGEKLALVGENGAGKTTLVKLLARLYEPSEGRILLDGVDLREYDLHALRAQVGVIFQDFYRFQLSAKDNIAVGRISNRDDMTQIESAADQSLASEVIHKLPAKYDQVLGRRFDNGVELSGGQWQKIALARAYMRDAQLLILDEPTAALDARAEYEVFQRFSELIHGRMAVLISHRFSTVRMADRILFLENGQLIELGSHDELIALKGRYAELFALQAQGYR